MAKMQVARLRIADEVFIVVATLHRENPHRDDFTTKEILNKANEMKVGGEVRRGFATHVSSHCVANSKPNPDKERMLFATSHGHRRLLLKSDHVHPQRDGRIFPNLGDVDPMYFELIAWAKQRYENSGPQVGRYASLLALQGSGKELWADEPADEYIARLRSGWE